MTHRASGSRLATLRGVSSFPSPRTGIPWKIASDDFPEALRDHNVRMQVRGDSGVDWWFPRRH